MSDANEIKPCPFCGSLPCLHLSTEDSCVVVSCHQCQSDKGAIQFSVSVSAKSLAEAIAIWNRRAGEDALRSALKDLLRQIKSHDDHGGHLRGSWSFDTAEAEKMVEER